MAASEKVKTIDNKIEQNTAQNNLERQTAKILALSSGHLGKYELLISEDILPEPSCGRVSVLSETFCELCYLMFLCLAKI